jgi:hypothetical protein
MDAKESAKMKMILKEMSDCKNVNAKLTLGKEYQIERVFGNGYVIRLDDDSDSAVLLQSRFVSES